jgi:hypothetical protein
LQTFDLDLHERTERCRMEIDVYTPTQQRRIVDELVFRTYTAPQMHHLLSAVGELELIATHDFSYRLDAPTEIAADTQDVVLILRKR